MYYYFNEDTHSGMTVFHQVIEALKNFISNITEAVFISARTSIAFVKNSKCSL